MQLRYPCLAVLDTAYTQSALGFMAETPRKEELRGRVSVQVRGYSGLRPKP